MDLPTLPSTRQTKKKNEVEYIDRPLGRTIKVKPKKQVQFDCKWLPCPLLCALLGRSGAGKSETCLTIAPYLEKVLGSVLVVTAIRDNEAFNSLSNWCESKDIEYKITHDCKFAEPTLSDMIERRDPNKFTLVVLDDFTDQYGRSPTARNSTVTNIYTRGRNYNCLLIMIAQGPAQLPPHCRNQCNLVICYGMDDENARRDTIRLCRNMVPGTVMERWTYLFDSLYEDPHSCFIVTKGNDLKSPHILVSIPEHDMKLWPADLTVPIEEDNNEPPEVIYKRLSKLKKYLDKIGDQEALDKLLELFPEVAK